MTEGEAPLKAPMSPSVSRNNKSYPRKTLTEEEGPSQAYIEWENAP